MRRARSSPGSDPRVDRPTDDDAPRVARIVRPAVRRTMNLLVLFVAGHLLGDFLFQTRAMVEGKGRPPVLAAHAALVIAAHLMALAPFWSAPIGLAVLGIGISHALIDAAKVRWGGPRRDDLAVFLLDQAAHLAVAIIAWLLLLRLSGPPALVLPAEWLGPWVAALATLAVFAFNGMGGSSIVTGVLATLKARLEEQEERSGIPGSGRLIGILERMLTLILIVLGQWAAILLLVTAKSIARFEELKDRRFAEYYLVGTLTSLLVATVTGLLLRALLVS